MKTVVIMRGVPGAGKGHYVKGLVADSEQPGRKHSIAVVSTDLFFEDYVPTGKGGPTPIEKQYKFDLNRLSEAHAFCMSGFLQALQMEVEVIVVDNTNIKRWMMEPYIKAARLVGYHVEVVEVVPEKAEDLVRCYRRNVHGVPVEIVGRMFLEFEPFEGATGISATF